MLKIRPAEMKDVPYLVDYNAKMAFETEHKTLDIAVLTKGVEAIMKSTHKGFYTVVEKEEMVIGQCLITMEWSDWRNGWVWWIQSVYVHESARRGGVWSSLYKHIRDLAKADEHVIGIRLYVERANANAKAAYGKLGMTDAGYDIMEEMFGK